MTTEPMPPGLLDLLLPPTGQSGMARDIEVLLNTRGRTLPPDHPRADDTTGDGYGTHALDLGAVSEAGDRKKLSRQIEEQLRRFDRRLREPTVTVDEDRTIRIAGWVTVRVRVRTGGQMKWNHKRRAVAFVAVQTDTGYSVKEVRP